MQGWNTHSGTLVYLPLDNIDTDQIIPARFMSQPRADGYEAYLFYDLRRDDSNDLRDNFPTHQHPGASILLAGASFGTGSSREAAAYALVDAGIRVVLATSFGDIFAANAVNNGLLPAVIDEAAKQFLVKSLSSDGSLQCNIDLEKGQLLYARHTVAFSIDDTWRAKLINGWDDIDLTLKHTATISAFSARRQQYFSWAWPTRS